MKIHRTKAIVLNRINYSEYDRIVHFLTPEGKINAIAKGVRKEKSRLSSGIEPLRLNDIVYRKSGGDLSLITGAKTIDTYTFILEDYNKLQFAYEAMNIVNKACETINEPEWFYLLKEILESLNNNDIEIEIIKGWFYANFARLLGYDLNLVTDTDGLPLDSSKKYFYDIDEKGLKENKNGHISQEHIKIMRLMINFSPIKISQVGGVNVFIKDCNDILARHAAVY